MGPAEAVPELFLTLRGQVLHQEPDWPVTRRPVLPHLQMTAQRKYQLPELGKSAQMMRL